MIKNLSKRAALFLVVMMLFTLFGCGGSTSDNSATTTSVTTESSEVTTTPAAPEPVTLTLSIIGAYVPTPGVQTDSVAKEIEKKTGITLDVTAITSETDYKTKLGALIAAGDLPDIFWVPSQQEQAIINNSNSAYDITELVKTNGKDMLANPAIKGSLEYSMKYLGNGKLIYIPILNGDSPAPTWPIVVPNIRWDLYKQLGYPEVKSWDDLLTVLAEMQKKFPTASNGKKAYGISLFSDWGDWPIAITEAWFGNINVGHGLSVDITDMSKLLLDYTDKNSPYFKSIKFYNKAKQMGILNPESATQKYDQQTAKVKAGQLYAQIPGWDRDLYQGNPGEGFAAIPLVENEKFVAGITSTKGGYNYAISANSKNPDRAVDLFNYLSTVEGSKTTLNGVKGITWDDVNGVEQYKSDIEAKVLKGLDATSRIETTVDLYHQFAMLSPNYKDPATGNYILISDSPDFLAKQFSSNLVLQDFITHYGYKTPGEPWFKLKANTYDAAIANALPTLPDDLKVIEDKVTNYKNINSFKLVMSKDDAELAAGIDKFIKDINDMGYQKVADWTMEQWAKIAPEVLNMGK